MVFWLVLFTCLLVMSVTANLVVVWVVVGGYKRHKNAYTVVLLRVKTPLSAFSF
jgi:hypothetical protein